VSPNQLLSLPAALINCVLDPLLMFAAPLGYGDLTLGFGWGIRGAAAATAMAQVAQAAVYAARLRARCSKLSVPLRVFEQFMRLRTVLDEGWQVLASNAVLLVRSVSILTFWVFCSALATRVGPASAAAHFTMINIWLIFVLSAEAPGVAAQVLSSRAVARGQKRYLAILVRQVEKEEEENKPPLAI